MPVSCSRWMNKHFHPLALLFTLVMLSLLAGGLLLLRMFYSQEYTYIFLLWNLFLAWLPIVFAALAQAGTGRVWRLGLSLLWLLFLPNAPYLITDLIHLSPGRVPLWYDATLLFVFALTGLFLGLVALRMMQFLVQSHYGRRVGWLLVLIAGVLSSFGVYAGRFWRWNSWDAILFPQHILADLLHAFAAPVNFARPLIFVTLFSGLFLGAYLFLMMIPHKKDPH